MIETITYNTTKEYKRPEGCSHFKVTTFGGSGQNGEGKNGGKGGAGEVKTVNVFCKEITIQTRFPKTSEDGKNSFPIVINGEELFEGYFGGKGGNDTCCIIMSGADKLTLYSKGGGGGGGSGYTFGKEKKIILGAEGGRVQNEIHYSATGVKGGRGQDGDLSAFFNEITTVLVSENQTYYGPAKLEIETL